MRTRDIVRQQVLLNHVSLQLDVVAPKALKKFGSVYHVYEEALKSTDVIYSQRVELSKWIIRNENIDLQIRQV